MERGKRVLDFAFETLGPALERAGISQLVTFQAMTTEWLLNRVADKVETTARTRPGQNQLLRRAEWLRDAPVRHYYRAGHKYRHFERRAARPSDRTMLTPRRGRASGPHAPVEPFGSLLVERETATGRATPTGTSTLAP